MNTNRPYVLSIAGFDPSAGAGVLADIKTMEQCGVYGLGVSTSITYQNENEFDGVKWLSFEEIEKQLVPLFRKYQIEIVKIGLIKNLELLEKTISCLVSHVSHLKIIWDPILSASAGFEFHADLEANRLNKILEAIYLITPNQPEFEKLKLESLDVSTNVLLKGGHREEHYDLLFLSRAKNQEPRFKIQDASVIKGSNHKLFPKHGSGCVLSSAIASYLALGNELNQSCELGKRYAENLLRSNEGLLGYHSISK